MSKTSCVRLLAAFSIICALGIGIYMNFAGKFPDTLSSRAVMVFCERR